MKLDKKDLVCSAVVVAIITLMIAASELMGEKEIIFPEIAAISAGMLIAPKCPWRTNRLRILLLITISAIIGVLVVLYLPFDKWLQMSVAYLLCQFIFVFSGTSFAPMISAAVLPIMLGTKSLVYIISAILLTVLILLVSYLPEKLHKREKLSFTPLPLPDKHDYIDIVKRFVLATAVIFLALFVDFRFAVAPPLLVAFTEFSKPSCPARQKPVKAVLLIAICAVLGTVSRLVICEWLALPLTVSAVFVSAGFIVVMKLFKMYLPPAGALGVLALLVSSDYIMIYPLHILCGATVFMLLSVLLFRRSAKLL